MAKSRPILSKGFRRIGDVALDERKRVSLTNALAFLKKTFGSQLDAGLRFGVYVNEDAQILLSPEVSVPVHERWLYRKPQALKSVLKGLEEAGAGMVKELGSFAKYADDDLE
jgi:hypothetical protein